ncbi:DUF2612 domain-containing protein [Pectobacterium odoriferum]|uniref:DUF2612 domain-containing protein n=1 Tax=Pectobacterium odoriferum TaxID=78398 RepID=UPI00052A9548|nr:DUF2612 domain-containing protein [Pectobacterium odoriferum]AIU88344.1 hypothetical protein BCS7_09495 [Pectobacterium odoriferum]POE20494.1 hypothetical protein BV918_02140 [Pectobacterium odoriferum]POE37214.1 hypothetical protein BV922_02135 [Pectobacterium odoriferum]
MYDHQKKALSRVYWQYKSSPKLIEWLKILPDIAQASIEEQADKIQRMLDIDTAEGEQLDICGRIVGYRTRPLGTFSPACQPAPVNDDLFRRMIRAKIFKNNSVATIDEIQFAADYIMNEPTRLLDGQDMEMRLIWFTHNVDIGTQKLIQDYDLIPRPQGVGTKDVRVITYKPFGFGQHYSNFRAPFWHGDCIKIYTNLKLTLTFSDGVLSGALTAAPGIVVSDIDVTLIYTLSGGATATEHLVTDDNGQFSTTPQFDEFTVVARAQVLTPLCEWENVQSGEVVTNIFFNGTVTFNGRAKFRG